LRKKIHCGGPEFAKKKSILIKGKIKLSKLDKVRDLGRARVKGLTSFSGAVLNLSRTRLIIYQQKTDYKQIR